MSTYIFLRQTSKDNKLLRRYLTDSHYRDNAPPGEFRLTVVVDLLPGQRPLQVSRLLSGED